MRLIDPGQAERIGFSPGAGGDGGANAAAGGGGDGAGAGDEIPVKFRGLVGKSFRPPEIYEKKPYSSTKVDSWCLGWSTFYLLTAMPLFLEADPAKNDKEYFDLFKKQNFPTLFNEKNNVDCKISFEAIDFIPQLGVALSVLAVHISSSDAQFRPPGQERQIFLGNNTISSLERSFLQANQKLMTHGHAGDNCASSLQANLVCG